jgi:hypothetical protein
VCKRGRKKNWKTSSSPFFFSGAKFEITTHSTRIY